MEKLPPPPPVTRIALYVRDMPAIADFYSRHFGFTQDRSEMPWQLILDPPAGGCTLVLLQASKGHKIGQSCIKIVFDVEDIEAFKEKYLRDGLEFGSTHESDGYGYANARDPAKNPIQISGRVFRGGCPTI